MAIIEGVGDEVTILFTIFILLVLIALAWVSTRVSEPRMDIFIIDWSHFANFLQRLQERRLGVQSPATETTSESASPVENVGAEGQAESETASTDVENQENSDVSTESTQGGTDSEAPQTDETPADQQENSNINEESNESAGNESETQNQQVLRPTETELRQRRLDFLSKGKPDSILSDEPSTGSIGNLDHQTIEATNQDAPSGQSTNHNEERQTDREESPNETRESQETDQEVNDNFVLPDGHIRVRLKYLDDRQKLVSAKPDDTIGQFKRAHFAREIAENFIVRFIFNGQELRQEASTLQSYNVVDNSVIHCLLSSQMNQTPRSEEQQDGEFDIGRYMFPLFAVVIGIVWYFRIAYRQYFNAMTSLTLFGITFLFIMTFIASLRSEEPTQQQQAQQSESTTQG